MERVRTIGIVAAIFVAAVFAMLFAHDDGAGGAIESHASRACAEAKVLAPTNEARDGVRVTRADAVADSFASELANENTPHERDPLDVLCATHVIGRVVRIVDGVEAGVPGAVVRAEAVVAGAAGVVDVRADRTGTFALELRERGTYRVCASVAGLASNTVTVEGMQSVTVDVGALVLEAVEAISGRVVDRRGRAIAGAVISDAIASCASDANGSFALDAHHGAATRLGVRADGFRPRWITVMTNSLEPCFIALDRALPIAGRVVDDDGRLVEGCAVRAGGVEVFTDARGRFEFEPGVEADASVAARHPRYGIGEAHVREGADAEIRLRRVASVVATLSDASRFGPAPRVELELLELAASGVDAQRVSFGIEKRWIDADACVVDGLELARRYRIRATGARGVTASAEVEVPAELPMQRLFARLEPRSGTSIDVTVVDARGAPIGGAQVIVAAQRESVATPEAPAIALTDRAGCATFAERPAARHMIRVEAPGCAPAFATVESCEDDVAPPPRSTRIVLERCARVAGSAPTPFDAARAPWVRATQTDGTSWTRLAADGSFALERLAAGVVELTLWPCTLEREPAGDAGLALPTRVVELTPGDEARVAFADDVSLPVHVDLFAQDGAGRGIDALTVCAMSNGRILARARTDDAGRARIELPWRGSFEFVAGDDHAGPHAALAEVALEPNPSALVVHVPSGFVEVSVRDRSGAPVAGFELEAWTIDGANPALCARATSTFDGSARFGPLAPAHIRIKDTGGRMHEVEVVDGESTRVEWTLDAN